MPTITTYPDGSQLTSTALTDTEIQTAFQLITAQMLGIITDPITLNVTLNSGSKTAAAASVLNIYVGELIVAPGLPTGTLVNGVNGTQIYLSNKATQTGQQVATVTDPNAFYKVRIDWQDEGQPGPPFSDDTVAIRAVTIDTEYSRQRDVTAKPATDTTMTSTDVYTRAWRVYWNFYGTNALDHSRAVTSGLEKIQFVIDFLSNINLYVNPDIEVPIRFRENFQGRWWERCDLFAEFNEQITETFTVGLVKSVEVIGFTKDGQFTDTTVTTP